MYGSLREVKVGKCHATRRRVSHMRHCDWSNPRRVGRNRDLNLMGDAIRPHTSLGASSARLRQPTRRKDSTPATTFQR
jgi:hypothetical protein